MQTNFFFQLDFRDALQRLAQDLRFEFQLARVRNVLIVAAAALLKIRAARLDSIGRSLNQTREISTRETRLLLPDVSVDLFTRQYKRDEYSHAATIGTGRCAGETVAAIDQFFNGEKHD